MNNELVQFDNLKADITLFVEPTKSIKVIDQESSFSALTVAKEVKSYQKRVEEKRKELVGPLNETVKRINEYAKSISEPLNASETHLKNELRTWELKLLKEREEARKKAEEERIRAESEALNKAELAKMDAITMALFLNPNEVKKQEIIANVEAERILCEINDQHNAQVKEINAYKVSGARKIWTFEITDESNIPREFLIVNEKAIRDSIRNGVRDITGIKIFQDTRIAI